MNTQVSKLSSFFTLFKLRILYPFISKYVTTKDFLKKKPKNYGIDMLVWIWKRFNTLLCNLFNQIIQKEI